MFCVSVQEPVAPVAGLVVHAKTLSVWLNVTGVDVEVSNAEPAGGLYVAVIECDAAVVNWWCPLPGSWYRQSLR